MDHFYIAGHTNPDGDCIGACFSLGLALEKMGKRVRVLLEPFHHKYDIIPGQHFIDEGIDQPSGDAVLICVDCADIDRLKGRARILMETIACTINIDHHFSNTQFAKYNYIDDKASSTCEMIYRILDGFIEVDKGIASALYAGMISDTGGFRHGATSQGTLQAAGKLTALGIPFTEIYTELLHLRSYTEVKLLGRVLDACRRSECGSVVHACVTKAMMIGFEDAPDAVIQDLEGMIDHLINIRGAKVALLVYDCCRDDEVKVSLRSREVNVGAVAQRLGGGGHHLAAGATVKGDIFEVRDRVLRLIG